MARRCRSRARPITAGVGSPLPVVLASAPPYNNVGCTAPAPPGLFTGKIVACERGPNRVHPRLQRRPGRRGRDDPLQHVAAGRDDRQPLAPDRPHRPAREPTQLLAFLAANPGATASFPQGTATTWQGDRVTTFSSRGPGGDWLKPDVTAPGLHILAGNTPTPEAPVGGPARQPVPGDRGHVDVGTARDRLGCAGLGTAPDVDAGPDQVGARDDREDRRLTKSDGITPADPFDVGGGRIDLTKAGDPGLTFDETAANYAASAGTPLNRSTSTRRR